MINFKYSIAKLSLAFLLTSQLSATINLTVLGGIGDQLQIEITQGDTFTATGSAISMGDPTQAQFFITFVNIWNNTADSLQNGTFSNFTEETVSLFGSNDPNSTGAVALSPITTADLILGFRNEVDSTNGSSLVLTTGRRVTNDNLSLNYTTAGVVSGTAFITNSDGDIISNSLSYTANVGVIPEPTTFALIAGTLGLVFTIARRRKVITNQK